MLLTQKCPKTLILFLSPSLDLFHKKTGEPQILSGQNVILPCQALRDKGSLRAVAWTKPDLQNKNVYLYRDGRFDPADQNPSFKNRVDLWDSQMKDGDVSLILKDVTINDAGTYECSVTQKKDLSPYTTTITVDLRVINSKGELCEFSVSVIKVESDVTLSCRAANNNKPIIVVKWSRRDLNGHYVLMYRDQQFVPDEQHPSFENRVDLQDRQMKNGDVSLILKDVTTADNGTYECHVVQGVKQPLKLISIIDLRVDPPGENQAGVATNLSQVHVVT
uniref:Ig-like domain-containing protein n=1 Tax=Neolamprologus brichardi TaxID=32507 RepID=A0A3Q4I1W1_NEOBR